MAAVNMNHLTQELEEVQSKDNLVQPMSAVSSPEPDGISVDKDPAPMEHVGKQPTARSQTEIVTWPTIATNNRFKALTPEQKEKVRVSYFNQVIAPRAPMERLDSIRAEFDRHTAIQQDEPESSGTGFFGGIWNSVKGAGERATDLAGGMVEAVTVADTATPQGMQMPSMGVGINWNTSTPKERETQAKAGHAVAEGLRDVDLGYDESRYTLDRAKQRFADGDYLGAMTQTLAAGLDTTATSLPDMVASLSAIGVPAYIAARTGELANERAVNKGLDRPGAQEMMEAAPIAIASAALERILPKRLVRGGGELNDEARKVIAEKAISYSLKKTAREAGTDFLIEGTTEALQEGVLEYVGTRWGTDAEMSVKEAMEHGADAFILGGVGGGTIGAGKGMVESIGDVRNARAPTQNKLIESPGDIEASLNKPIDINEELAKLESDIASTSAILKADAETFGYSPEPSQSNLEVSPLIQELRDQELDTSNNPEIELSPETAQEAELQSTALPEVGQEVQWSQSETPVVFDGIAGEMNGQKIASVIVDGKRTLVPAEELLNTPIEQNPNDHKTALNAPLDEEVANQATGTPYPVYDEAAPTEAETSEDLEVAQQYFDNEQEVQSDLPVSGQTESLEQAPDSRIEVEELASTEEQSDLIKPQVENTEGISEKPEESIIDEVNTEPTEAQKEAGNYKKAHLSWNGLDISIENPKGSTRSGTDKNGKAWSNKIHHDYGDIKGTEGGDGDNIDVFMGPIETDKVFVVNQTHADGSFDEHKVMTGFDSKADAEAGYLVNYDKGWSNYSSVIESNVEDFKAWLDKGKTTKEFGKKETLRKKKASMILGAKVGDTVTLSQDFDYLTKGKPYTIESISNGGEVHFASKGGGAVLDLSMLNSADRKGVVFSNAQVSNQTMDKPKEIPSFSLESNKRAVVAGSGALVSKVEADKVIGNVTRRWRNRDMVSLVDSASDLPSAITDYAKKQGYSSKSIEGVMHNETIYIVRENMKSAADIEQVIFHEAYGHYGVRLLLGKGGIKRELGRLYFAIGGAKGFNDLAKKHNIDLSHYVEGAADLDIDTKRAIIMDELLAHIAQNNKPSVKRFLNELVGAIRKWLRAHGYLSLSNVSDAEIFNLLKRSRKAVISGKKTSRESGSDNILFSLKREPQSPTTSNAKGKPPGSNDNPSKEYNGFIAPKEREVYGLPVDVLLRKFVDKMRPLTQVQRSIQKATGVQELEDNVNTSEFEIAFSGKTENDLLKIEDLFIQPMIDKMTKHGITQDELDVYLWARHAKERNAQVAKINPSMQEGGSGMTDTQAANILRLAHKEGKLVHLSEIAQYVYKMLDRRKALLKANLIGRGADAWDGSYKYYVPLKGHADDKISKEFARTGKGFDIRGKETLRALGRRTKPESPSIHAIIDTTETVIRSRKNEVGNAFLAMVEKYPKKDYWEVFTNENPDTDRRIIKIQTDASIKARKDHKSDFTKNVTKEIDAMPEKLNKEEKAKYRSGKMETYKAPKAVFREEVREQAISMHMAKAYFGVKRDGKEYFIKIHDENLLRAMKNMGPESMGAFMQFMGKISRFLSMVNTSLSPEFVITNAIRDLPTAVINIMAEQDLHDGKVRGKKIAAKMVKGVFHAGHAIYITLKKKEAKSEEAKVWQKYFNEFLEDGAKTGWFDMLDVEGQAKKLERMMDMSQGSMKGKLLKTKKFIGNFVDDANTSVENAVRLSAYRYAREAGVSRQKAAVLAKSLTVNFNRSGELGPAMNVFYIFTNAAIQGSSTFYRAIGTFKEVDGKKKLGVSQQIALAAAASAFGLAALNRQSAGEDEDGENWYDKVPGYVKERNIVVMNSVWGGEPGEFMKLPLPYGYNIFSVIGANVEAVMNGNMGIGEGAALITKAAIGSFFPIGVAESESLAGSITRTVAPTVLKPLVDFGYNENFWASEIYRENYRYGTPKPESSLSKRSTSPVWKGLAEFMNEATGGNLQMDGAVDINPDKMGYLFDYFTGSAGNFVDRSITVASKLANGQEIEDREIPFFRKVSGSVSWYQDQTTFYGHKDSIGQISNRYKALEGKDRIAFKKKYKKEIDLIPDVKETEKKLRKLRKERNAIEANEHLSLAEKDKKLDVVARKMKWHIDKFNKKWTQ